MALEWLDGRDAGDAAARAARQEKLRGLAAARGAGFHPTGHRGAGVRAQAGDRSSRHQAGQRHGRRPAHAPSLQVLDFGIAKLVASERPAAGSGDTRTDSVPAFSPTYAAPEQVQYSRTGPWTDVHALGLILTELLTDEPPYADHRRSPLRAGHGDRASDARAARDATSVRSSPSSPRRWRCRRASGGATPASCWRRSTRRPPARPPLSPPFGCLCRPRAFTA